MFDIKADGIEITLGSEDLFDFAWLARTKCAAEWALLALACLTCPDLSCLSCVRACLIMYSSDYITISEPSFAGRVYLRLFWTIVFPWFLGKRDRPVCRYSKRYVYEYGLLDSGLVRGLKFNLHFL